MVFSVAIYAALAGGVLLLAGRGVSLSRSGFLRPWPVLTTAAVSVIGVVSTLQLAVAPALLVHLGRDAAAIHTGEVWRLVTAICVQDGGWLGFGSNLLTLALIGIVAERLLGRRRWLIVFGVSVLVAEVVGLWFQPVGAGNSVAVAGLCGAVACAAVRTRVSVLPATVSVVAFAALAVTRDIHGAAGMVGVAVGFMVLPGAPALRSADGVDQPTSTL